MPSKPSIVERAYELAGSSGYHSLGKIEHQLALEGYEDVEDHFSSPVLRKEIRAIWKTAAAKGD